jgi:MOSC domain-containing protein YiiM
LIVTGLFLKRKHGVPLDAASSITCGTDGITGNVACVPFRQALIASLPVMTQCGLKPGDLRENIVVDFDRLYELPSGTVVKIGQVLLRLTFHCEPCRKILKLIDFDSVVHRRGVFGNFLSGGCISIGDRIVVTEQQMEPIPYAINERIRWFLRKHGGRAAARDLVHAIGLPSSYARAMPRLTKKLLGARETAESVSGDW